MLYSVYFHTLGEIGILISSLPALAGVYRLARFNVNATLEDKNYFTGMPIPAAAIYIITFIMFHYLSPELNSNIKTYGIFTVAFSAPHLMISRIKFDNLPRPSWKSIKARPWNAGISLVGLIAIIISQGKMIFPFLLLYILISVLRPLFNLGKEKNKKRKLRPKKELF
jgi:CDP-diacylglycerol--serine O-phosphatidyltransferase